MNDSSTNGREAIQVFFGRFLLKEKLISEEQLDYALQIQEELMIPAVITMEFGLLNQSQFQTICMHQREFGKTFMDAARDLSLLDEQAENAIYELVDGNSLRVGEILVRQGALTEPVLQTALAQHHRKKAD